MRRNLRPLTPLFNPEKQRGAIVSGNTPVGVPPDPIAHYDASETSTLVLSGSTITSWADLTTTHDLTTVVVGGPQSGVRTMNSLNVANFTPDDGISTASPFWWALGSKTTFIVANVDVVAPAANVMYLLGEGLSTTASDHTGIRILDTGQVHVFFRQGAVGLGTTVLTSPASVVGAPVLITVVDNGTTMTLRLNGVTVDSDTYTTVALSLDSVALGVIRRTANQGFLDGAIGEVRIYDSALSEPHLSAVETLLMNKWFPTTGFSDDFNRADGALGANWSAIPGWSITTNTVVKTSSTDDGSNLWVGTLSSDDHWAEMDILVASGQPVAGTMQYLAIRSSTPGTGYLAGWHGSSSGRYRISLDNAGTMLAESAVVPYADWEGHRARFEAVGTTLNLYVDGVLVLTTTDGTHSGVTRRKAGFGAGTGGGYPAHFDNFATGTI